jgi:hypothetical protein
MGKSSVHCGGIVLVGLVGSQDNCLLDIATKESKNLDVFTCFTVFGAVLWMVNPAPVDGVSGVSHYFVRREKPSELGGAGP